MLKLKYALAYLYEEGVDKVRNRHLVWLHNIRCNSRIPQNIRCLMHNPFQFDCHVNLPSYETFLICLASIHSTNQQPKHTFDLLFV
jgi:hypothetical protein